MVIQRQYFSEVKMSFSSYVRALIAAALAALFCVSAFGQGAGFSRQINGQVRYADSMAPAENVLVRVEGFTAGMAGQLVTDRTGKFYFGGLHAEQYRISFHAPGYNDIEQIVDLMTSPVGLINPVLVRNKDSSEGRTNAVVDANVPQSAQDEFNKGKAILDAGETAKMPEAMQHLEKAVTIYPKYFAAQLALGLAYMDSKQWGKAEKPLLAAIGTRQDASTPYFALGEVYLREKKYAEGEKIVLEGLKLSPDSAEGHTTLGELYSEMAPSSPTPEAFKGRLQSSWNETQKALKLKPAHAPAHLLAGNLLLKARRPKEALEHYEQYLKLDPKGPYVEEVNGVVKKIKEALAQTDKK